MPTDKYFLMNIEKLNQWLSLTANLGVLIGIVVVAIELSQTQTAMVGAASSTRSQVTTDISQTAMDVRLNEIFEKLDAGDNLTNDERLRAGVWLNAALRFVEDQHFQNQLGVLDDEIWEAVLRGWGDICTNSIFQLIHPTWGKGKVTQGFRESFVLLIAEPCIQ